MTPSGIEPATCRLAPQCLHQLRHHVPPHHTHPFHVTFFLQGNLCRPSHGNKITASVMRKIPSQMYLFYVYSSMDFCFSRNTVNFNPCPRTHVAHSKVLKQTINPLNAQLNPICHLLALLGAHHILHVSKIWVKSHLPFASIIKSSPYSPR